MREYLISHGWLLIPIAVAGILAASFAVFMMGNYCPSSCHGFKYFGFIDHRATASNFSIQLVNGRMPVIVTGITAGSAADDSPAASQSNIQPGTSFIIRSEPIGLAEGSQYSNMLVKISYDIINGEANNTDSAFCAGRVA